ncbi:MAG TPA: hypothetical protein VMS79_03620 [Methanomassiliicoccales archaeon]|nr:hypothetical protein [Methanomassiliicoccales archaeon]
MTTVGMCMICGRPATHTCAICGRLVCDQHFNRDVGMCTICAPKTKRAVGSEPGDEPLGPAQ